MARSFIGSGMSFPLKLDPNGAVAVSHDEDNIEQCIKIILGTAKGERLYRPAFGCAIHDLVFSPNTHVTAMKVENAVKDSLYQFEPRIKDIEVKALCDDDDPNRLNVHISYVVMSVSDRDNMVYPFYLRREEDV